MNLQLKPESEFTQQGYLYLMEKSEPPAALIRLRRSHFLSLFCRSLHGNMAEILLHVQEAKQTVHDAAVQSTDTWPSCKSQSEIKSSDSSTSHLTLAFSNQRLRSSPSLAAHDAFLTSRNDSALI